MWITRGDAAQEAAAAGALLVELVEEPFDEPFEEPLDEDEDEDEASFVLLLSEEESLFDSLLAVSLATPPAPPERLSVR
jgi:hypothetical protein